jgi:hypothetical protein
MDTYDTQRIKLQNPANSIPSVSTYKIQQIRYPAYQLTEFSLLLASGLDKMPAADSACGSSNAVNVSSNAIPSSYYPTQGPLQPLLSVHDDTATRQASSTVDLAATVTQSQGPDSAESANVTDSAPTLHSAPMPHSAPTLHSAPLRC